MDSDDSLSTLSSPMTSLGSRSPSPPAFDFYPSPTSSQEHRNGSVTPMTLEESRSLASDGPPPAKKRKIAEPKVPQPRETRRLNLRRTKYKEFEEPLETQQPQLELLLHTLQHRKKIVIIAGAGISVAAGSKLRPKLQFWTIS
jgi:NAD+-dependent protein deacetylase SIR2